MVTIGEADAYEVPEGVDVASMIAASSGEPRSQVARVRVAPDRAHALRRWATASAAGADGDVLEIAYSDDEWLARELVGLGADAVVLEPPGLRDAVVRRLRAVLGEAS
jgi:proteasome accessory factor B